MLSLDKRRTWIEPCHKEIFITRQCHLAGLPRSTFYAPPRRGESEESQRLMKEIDRIYTKWPFYGSPRIADELRHCGWTVGENRVARLMRVINIQAISPGPHTSKPHPKHKVFPYLLRGLEIVRPDQVWSADITYIPLHRGFLFLMAIIDWFSRYVLAWELSNTLETDFCLRALRRALSRGMPEIFNTDQGSQFTSAAFTDMLLKKNIRVSMDGRGRALDNVFIERLWRSVKYEEVYPKDYGDGDEAFRGLRSYFRFYNHRRRHQSLDRLTPAVVYCG